MSEAQLDLLSIIRQGKYIPTIEPGILTTLAALYRHGYIKYTATTVTLTGPGRLALESGCHVER